MWGFKVSQPWTAPATKKSFWRTRSKREEPPPERVLHPAEGGPILAQGLLTLLQTLTGSGAQMPNEEPDQN